ncbi:hypothetical protein FYJ33_15320 [Clostridiaceae bacterium WCA-383-APC-5B]|uniref:Uncharacterized protein n=2 Tax=Inconstantimicrobium porci TaxID=2652291 RepID=A0A7X2N102_9CLOT|nr:hypothetical protein [Inconstantimicrobium porci]
MNAIFGEAFEEVEEELKGIQDDVTKVASSLGIDKVKEFLTKDDGSVYTELVGTAEKVFAELSELIGMEIECEGLHELKASVNTFKKKHSNINNIMDLIDVVVKKSLELAVAAVKFTIDFGVLTSLFIARIAKDIAIETGRYVKGVGKAFKCDIIDTLSSKKGGER